MVMEMEMDMEMGMGSDSLLACHAGSSAQNETLLAGFLYSRDAGSEPCRALGL